MPLKKKQVFVVSGGVVEKAPKQVLKAVKTKQPETTADDSKKLDTLIKYDDPAPEILQKLNKCYSMMGRPIPETVSHPNSIRSWLAVLFFHYPKVFHRTNPRPLKIGINEDIIKAGLIPERIVGVLLRRYTYTPAYQRCLIKGGARYDLDGNECGQVTCHQQYKARRLGNRICKNPKDSDKKSTKTKTGDKLSRNQLSTPEQNSNIL